MSVTINDKPVNGGALSRLMSIVKSVFWPKSQVEEGRLVTLGEVAFSNDYEDLDNKPEIPTVDANPASGSSNAVSSGGVFSALQNKADAVTVGSSMPSGGFLPNVFYNLGVVTGSVTWSLAAASLACDEYMIQFTADSTAPTITWPSGLTWIGGAAPTITGDKTYQISIQNNLAVYAEF